MRQKKPYLIRDGYIPLDKINVLPQMRQTFDGIEGLADDILEKGLIHAITIASLKEEKMRIYVKYVEQVFKKKIDINSLISYTGSYFILIAGERRLRACKTLDERRLYHQRFGNHKIKSTICVDISPEEAIKLQGSENMRDPIPPHEEAEFLDKYYRFLEKIEPVTHASFARSVGRSSEVIRSALRFSKLPQFIHRAVRDHVLAYGCACELGRLYERGIRGKELRDWFISVIVKDYKVDEFQRIVRKHLIEKDSIQTSLLDSFFSLESEKEAKQEARRRSIDQKVSDAFHYQSRYFLKVLYLFEHGFLGLEDSPFSLLGPLRAFESLIRLVDEKVIPHLEKVVILQKDKNLLKKGKPVFSRALSLTTEARPFAM